MRAGLLAAEAAHATALSASEYVFLKRLGGARPMRSASQRLHDHVTPQ
jgi:hypothetical protein